ncbi:MAG: hypothetical protein AB7J13_09950 [Pyrinomonadaceae bacterium]
MRSLVVSLFFGAIVFASVACNAFAIPSRITILPENFTGVVIVVFGESASVAPNKEEGKILYRIPKSGTLLVSSPPLYEFIGDEYFYESPDGQRKKLRYIYPGGGAWKDKEVTFDNVGPDSEEIFCMADELGTIQIKGKTVHYRSFLVGRAQDVDSLANQVSEKLRKISL